MLPNITVYGIYDNLIVLRDNLLLLIDPLYIYITSDHLWIVHYAPWIVHYAPWIVHVDSFVYFVLGFSCVVALVLVMAFFVAACGDRIKNQKSSAVHENMREESSRKRRNLKDQINTEL